MTGARKAVLIVGILLALAQLLVPPYRVQGDTGTLGGEAVELTRWYAAGAAKPDLIWFGSQRSGGPGTMFPRSFALAVDILALQLAGTALVVGLALLLAPGTRRT